VSREDHRTNRRIGLEQEFFLVEESGRPSERADEFLARCGETTAAEGRGPACMAPEFVKGLVEVNTPPVRRLADLEREYANNLRLALRSARESGLRLYPLGTYPLPLDPAIRDEPDYRVQVGTVGQERFMHAGRCAGTHLHLELPAGTVDAAMGVSPGASEASRGELLNLHNLATALDPALVFLTRSCPFYEGRTTGLASRTARYRGSAVFDWDGVYKDLPEVGALLPYAEDTEHLVRLQFDRYHAWLSAMDRASVDLRLFLEAGGDLLRPAWNPVRLNRQGTLELRGMDSNFPEVTLAVVALVLSAADRVRTEGLTVTPDEDVRAFEVADSTLRVPGFDRLGGEMLRASVAGSQEDPAITLYIDSVLEFARDGRLDRLRRRRQSDGFYPTTEADLLRDYAPQDGWLPEGEGLRLVLQACDELESQVLRLSRLREPEGDPVETP
jgi:hypothetical protein